MKKSLLFTMLFILSLSSSLFAEDENFFEGGEFSISLSMSFSNVDNLGNAISFVGQASLPEFMADQVSLGKIGAANINSINKVETEYLNRSSAAQASGYAGLSLKEKADALNSFVSNEYSIELPQSILLMDLSVTQMIGAPSDWKESLGQIKGQLSFDEKIRLASYLGGRLSSDYNSERSAEGLNATGVVSIEEMLENLSNENPGGICRDITLAQSQILQELGVDKNNIYQMSYAVAKGHHAVLVIQDPNDPTKVVKINYDLVQTNENVSGGSSLYQDGILADTGIVYKIYDANGVPVDKVPSEIGKIFREVTDYQDNIDQGVNPYNLTKTVVRSRWVDATIFSGQLSTGESVNGIALSKTFQYQNSYKEFGLAYLERIGSAKADSTIDQDAIFARVKDVQTRELQIGAIVIEGHAGAEIEGAYLISRVESKSRDKVIEGNTIDAHGAIFGGASITYTTDAATYMAGLDLTGMLDFNNLAEAYSSGYGVFKDDVQLTGAMEKNLTSDISINAKVMITFKNVGEVATIELGLKNQENLTAIDFLYQTPLSEMPLFIDGSTEIFRLGASKEVTSNDRKWSSGNLYLGGVYDKTVETGEIQALIEFKF
jgi:hypothetical protein